MVAPKYDLGRKFATSSLSLLASSTELAVKNEAQSSQFITIIYFGNQSGADRKMLVEEEVAMYSSKQYQNEKICKDKVDATAVLFSKNLANDNAKKRQERKKRRWKCLCCW